MTDQPDFASSSSSIQWSHLDAHDWRDAAIAASAEEGVRAALAAIDEQNSTLNAFSVVYSQSAIDRARELDSERDAGFPASDGEPLPLHGVPVGIKDEFDVEGTITTFGTRAMSTPAAADSESVRRLREAGAIIIGKTHMPEFGAWPFTATEFNGVTRNPIDHRYSPGGSSGGTAAAVAAGIVPLAMGGDGGGSIRIPSAACGLFGLKPQRGRVSTAPYPNIWGELGTAGPLTRTVRDSALVYDIIAGTTEVDDFSAQPIGKLTDARLGEGKLPERLRIGVVTATASPLSSTDPANVAAVARIAANLAEAGHEIVAMEKLPDATASFVPQFFAGVRGEGDLMEHYERLEQRSQELYSLGFWAKGSVLDWAKREGRRLGHQLNEMLNDVDVILTPTLAARPARAEILSGKGAVGAMLGSEPYIAFTALANVTGHPAAAIPVGTAHDGLPESVQIIGQENGEELLVALARQILGEA